MTSPTTAVEPARRRRRGPLAAARRGVRTLGRHARRNPLLFAGLVLVTLLVVTSLLAPVIAPYDPRAITGDSFEDPSPEHLLGTNDAGSDNLSRLLHGGRSTILIATASTAMILTIGLAVGLTAGLRGGFVDTALMRVVDVFLALPILPLLIFIAALAGPGVGVSILMIGLFTWPQTARIVRSQTLSLRNRGFVDCARAFGGGPWYVVRRHLIPALGPVIAANLVYVASVAVIIASGLAFIGLSDPSTVSWGDDISRGTFNPRVYLGNLWIYVLLPPGLALTLAILGLTFIGVGLEPRANPRWSRTR